MTIGSYSLAQQIGGKGYFARVSLEVEMMDRFECKVDFVEDNSSKWAAGAIFGATHAWEQYLCSKPDKSGLKVTILDIEWQPVDTSNLVVAYVTTLAVWNALGWEPSHPLTFDPKNGTFGFSKF